MTQKLSMVPVSKIEQPLDLGNLCRFLNARDKNPYIHNAESVMQEFLSMPTIDRFHQYCMKNESCAIFIQEWQKGVTPFWPADTILIKRHGGHYQVSEGKHRLCAAIQGGIDSVSVPVEDDAQDFSFLLPLGQPGVFSAQFHVNLRHQTRTGEIFFLHTAFTEGFSRSDAQQGLLGLEMDCTTNWSALVTGVEARQHILTHKRWGRAITKSWRIEVRIRPDLPLGKVWLARKRFIYNYPSNSDVVHCFRRGLYRQSDLSRLFYRSCSDVKN